VRIYLDASQLAEREPAKVFQDLAQTRGVEIRVKRENSALMHLKSYEIDGFCSAPERRTSQRLASRPEAARQSSF